MSACMPPYPKAFGFKESNLQCNISVCPGLLSLSSLHSPVSMHLILMDYSGKLQVAGDLQKMSVKEQCFQGLLPMSTHTLE